MVIIAIQALGAAIFLAGSVWLGIRIRRGSDKSEAERISRISHLLFWSCLALPGLVGLFYPGLTRYDKLLGIPSLPLWPVTFVIGLLALAVGLVLLIGSNRALVRLGRGAPAFLLTEQLVSQGFYRWTRNPMALGYYLACVGAGLMAGSATVTFGALLVVVPVHMFNLKFFEERELELRYGQSYTQYKRRVPFLLPKFGQGMAGG